MDGMGWDGTVGGIDRMRKRYGWLTVPSWSFGSSTLALLFALSYSYSNLSSTPLHHLLPPSLLPSFINK